ncbi:MAG TPA: FUSC family protein [Candidatus Aquilonibacter sp.]|nr:FUSC family protein [Candidatus Aquilonibacter sp.]
MLKHAALATISILVSFLVMWAACESLHADPSVAVLGAVVALGLSRPPEGREHPHLFVEAAGLVLIGLLAAGAGLLLRWNLFAGGALFTTCVAASMWLRGLHDDARVLGRVVALPFITMLIAPVRPQHGTGIVLLFIAPLVALAVCRLIQRRPQPIDAPPARERKVSTLRPPVHVRMALQMFVALALAFVLGALFFRAHWPWIVLSAFIVCAGALGRADALYKGSLRLAGALGGGVTAALVTFALPANGILDALVIFGALFAGIALRPLSYAWWAAATTLIFALLQRGEATVRTGLYLARLECIVIGALCGIVAACLVLPLKTRDIARRRIADALAAIEHGATRGSAATTFADKELARLAGPLRLHRVVTFALHDGEHPAEWIAVMRSILAHDAPSNVTAIRQARRAIRDQDGITAALRALSP